MNSLTMAQTKDADGTLRVALSGQIDEDADYSVVKLAGVKRVVFDFDGVRLINSTGIQRWIKFLAEIPKGADVVFSRCAIRVVTQINLFPGFLGGRAVDVESFYAPYFCEACDSSCDILLTTAKHVPNREAPKAPEMQCPRCQGPAEFDGIEKKFFLFLKPT